MQTAERILKLVHGLIAADKAERLGVDSRLLDDGGIDSFGLVSLVAEIEAAFSITISTEDLTAQNFHSVRDIVRLVDCCVGAAQQAAAVDVNVPDQPAG